MHWPTGSKEDRKAAELCSGRVSMERLNMHAMLAPHGHGKRHQPDSRMSDPHSRSSSTTEEFTLKLPNGLSLEMMKMQVGHK